VVDARGGTGYFYFDAAGRVIGQVDPLGHYTQTVRDVFGNAITINAYADPVAVDPSTMPAGQGKVATTRMEYDALNRLVKTTDAMGGVESYTYDAYGNRTSVTNKLGGLTRYVYDALGRLFNEIFPFNTVDRAGNPQVAYNQYTYDARGNRIHAYLGFNALDERSISYTYDAADRLISQVSGNGNDELGRETPIDARANVYDARGNLIRSQDANGQWTLYYYDLANRQVAQISPLGAQVRTEYDAAGNKTRTLSYADMAGVSPSQWGAPLGQPPGAAIREVRYTYDAGNRLIAQFQPNVVTAQAVGGASSTAKYETALGISQGWVYDASGQLVSHTDGAGHVTRTWYNAAGQAVLSIDAEGYVTTWTRDADGNVLTETRYATKYSGDASA
ncbi:hypothetical protein KCV01_g24712, partial [Aureobasidium melanogenum]